MATTSKYAKPLEPEKLEEAARKVYAVHQRGDKDRGNQIEKIVQEATLKADERDMIFLRAQRLQLDGIPANKPTKDDNYNQETGHTTSGPKPPKKAVEASKPPARTPDPRPRVKSVPAQSSTRQSTAKKPVIGPKRQKKAEPPTPF